MKVSKKIKEKAKILFAFSMDGDGFPEKEKIELITNHFVKNPSLENLTLLREYSRILRLESKKQEICVESASSLSEETKKLLIKSLKISDDLLPRRMPFIHYLVNPSLIAGIKIYIESEVFDNTFFSRIQKISC